MQRPAFSQSPNRVGSGPSRPPISRGSAGGCGDAGGRGPALDDAAEGSIWWAWAATGGTPGPVVDKLNREVAEVLKRPDVAKRFTNDDAVTEINSPAQIRKMIADDLVKWAKVAQDAKMPKK